MKASSANHYTYMFLLNHNQLTEKRPQNDFYRVRAKQYQTKEKQSSKATNINVTT
jgi:hypothetical protein